MFKKKKVVKTTTLKNKLDRIFSKYIRLRSRYKNSERFVCISCGKTFKWDQIDNGHYFGRGDLSLRYDEENCNAQCRTCNQYLDGNKEKHKEGMINKYGEDIIERLQAKRNRSFQIKESKYKELIKHYIKKVEELETSS